MAIHTGETGIVAIGSYGDLDANLTAWSVTESQETVDSTSFAPTGGWREKLPSLSTWSGTFEGYFDDTTPNQLVNAGAVVAATFSSAVTGISYAGDIVITEISSSASVDGMATVSASFDGTAALVKANLV